MRHRDVGSGLSRGLALLLVCAVVVADDAVDRVMRVHDIGFLTREVPQYPLRVRPHAGGLGIGGEGGGRWGRPDWSLSFEEESTPRIAAVVQRLLRASIAEDSWSSERNEMVFVDHGLHVRQTAEVQRTIERVLGRLRVDRAKMIAVDVAVVPVEALVDQGAIASPWIDVARFDTILRRGARSASLVSLAAYNEQTMSGLSGQYRSTAVDTEINSTGVIPVSNVVVQRIPIGVSVEIRPQAISGTGWYRVRLVAARLRIGGDVVKRETLFGDLEMVPLREESLSAELLLDETHAGIAGLFDDIAADGTRCRFAVIARLRTVEMPGAIVAREPAADGGGDVFRLEVHDVSFLLGSLGPRLPVYDPVVLVELLRHRVDRDSWTDRRAALSVEGDRYLLVTARSATRAAVREWLLAEARERARVARVTIREIEGPADALARIVDRATDGLHLAKAWRETDDGKACRTIFDATTAGALGSPMLARGLRARNHVADVETISGGTGFTVTEIPDPVIASAGTGFELTVHARWLHDGGRVRLGVDLRRCVTTFENSAVFLAAVDLNSTPRGAAGISVIETAGGRTRARHPYRIDLPSQDSMRCSVALALQPGREVVLRHERSRGGRGRLVTARVDVSSAVEENGGSR